MHPSAASNSRRRSRQWPWDSGRGTVAVRVRADVSWRGGLTSRGVWAGVARRYVLSVYWALMTLTTVGYGDIVPTSDCERLVVLLSLFVGAFVFGSLLSALGDVISTINVNAARIEERMREVKTYLRWHHTPPELASRVRRYALHTTPARARCQPRASHGPATCAAALHGGLRAAALMAGPSAANAIGLPALPRPATSSSITLAARPSRRSISFRTLPRSYAGRSSPISLAAPPAASLSSPSLTRMRSSMFSSLSIGAFARSSERRGRWFASRAAAKPRSTS